MREKRHAKGKEGEPLVENLLQTEKQSKCQLLQQDLNLYID